MKTNYLVSAGIAAMLLSTTAAATIITFAGNGGANQQASASFNFTDANHFVLTLTNTGNIVDIAGVLDDFHFNLSGTPTGGAGLGTITSGGHVDCTASTNSVSSCTNNGVTDATGQWPYALTGAHVDLVAGNGMHPYGIVNNSIFTNANLDGLRNGEHNPYLLGPVSFAFTYTGLTDISITNVDFTFGTTPAHVAGTPCTSPTQPNCGGPPNQVPEPQTLGLLGLGLLGLALLRRRRTV